MSPEPQPLPAASATFLLVAAPATAPTDASERAPVEDDDDERWSSQACTD